MIRKQEKSDILEARGNYYPHNPLAYLKETLFDFTSGTFSSFDVKEKRKKETKTNLCQFSVYENQKAVVWICSDAVCSLTARCLHVRQLLLEGSLSLWNLSFKAESTRLVLIKIQVYIKREKHNNQLRILEDGILMEICDYEVSFFNIKIKLLYALFV